MFNELNTLKIFFKEPIREYNIREVARIIKKAPATISKELKKYQKKGILQERKERMLKLYKANIENDLYRDIKVFFLIREIKESGLLEELNNFYLKPTIVLFGSAAQGRDTETSDIDVCIITEKTQSKPSLQIFEKRLKRPVQLIVTENIKGIKNKQLIINIINGITIQGKIKWM